MENGMLSAVYWFAERSFVNHCSILKVLAINFHGCYYVHFSIAPAFRPGTIVTKSYLWGFNPIIGKALQN
jgi:hypothetical protein